MGPMSVVVDVDDHMRLNLIGFRYEADNVPRYHSKRGL